MKNIFLAVILSLCSIVSFSQKKHISTEEAAYNWDLYPKSLYYLQWISGTNNYIYLSDNKLIIKNAQTNKEQKIITLSEFLSVYPSLQYFPPITYVDNSVLVFKDKNVYHLFNYQQKKNERTITLDENAQNPKYHHLKKAVAYTLDNNLYLATDKNPKIAITTISDKNIVSGQSIHRNEFGISEGIFWSPKGNYIAFYQKDETHIKEYPLVDISSGEAKLNAIKYPMAGQKSEQAKVGIFNLETQSVHYLDIDTSDEHYLTNLTWSPDEKDILLAEVARSQKSYSLNRYDAINGKRLNTILTEKNSKWVEPEHSAVYSPDGKNFVWLSEKSGFMNAYLYTNSGKFVRQITNNNWVINKVLGFDNEGEYLFVSGTGTNPLENHTFKVHIKSKKHTQLTPTEGTHRTQLNFNGQYLLDTYSSLTIPNVVDVVNTHQNSRNTIFKAENPLKEYKIGSVELLKLKADDQKTDLYAKIIKPKNFDPDKKYPVLLYVYGGPHSQFVTNSWTANTELWMMAMAENEDYIIFTLDNRGTDNRGFAFESIIHQNLATYAVKDQMTAVNYLKSLSYVDSRRMSVYGWSFGGFMASSLMLRHPSTFNVAVAGGAVTDWRLYEVMYGERYMDTPSENPKGYEDTKIAKYIPNLKGKLLFIHGYKDDVVLPQHMLEVSQESVKQHKVIDTFVYPLDKHNVSSEGYKHLVKYITEYIIEHNK